MEKQAYQDWIVVFRSGTDYESDLVRDRLDDAGVSAVVLTQRDHAFNLNVGELSNTSVLVPPDQEERALEIIESAPFTDEELSRAAMSANPDAPPAHNPTNEAMLDSGPEEITLSAPDDEDSIPDQ